MLTGLLNVSPARYVEVAGRRLDHAQLLATATAVADDLADVERVAVLATPTLETVVGVVGALLAGVSVVPVPPDSGTRELEHFLRDSAPDAWLGAAGDDTIPTIRVNVSARADMVLPEVTPDATAFVLYTSGTTGLPKGVLMSRRSVMAGLDGLAEAWEWTGEDTVAHGLPLFHVHGLILGVLGPLRLGGSVIHVGKGTPEAYASAADPARGEDVATMWFAVPTIWSRLVEQPDLLRQLSIARLLVSGSAALPVPVFEKVREITGLEPVERYGMSETLITVATRADGEPQAGWVGVPIAAVETRLVDEYEQPVPRDGESVGNLQVRGATTFEGYLNRTDATAEAWTPDGWFRTGDVAVIAPDGRHRIVGRESVDLIKSGGWRIGAGEIESTLLGHPAVAECAVVGEPDTDLGQRIVAHVVLRDGFTGSDELAGELISVVGSELSAHKRPREVRWATGLPRNEMGKVQKKRLLEP